MHPLPQARALAALTVLEAVRGRLPWLVGAILLGAFGLAELVGALSITESARAQSAALGAVLRLAAVLVTALFVVSSVVREIDDKFVEVYLSLPMRRAVYYLGKLAGFALCALAGAVLFGLLVSLYAPAGQAALWALSLFAELLLVAAASLLCLFTFSQVTIALAVVLAFYLLGRSIGAMQLMTQGPLVDPNALTSRLVEWLVDAIAFLVPDLYRFTPTEWLVYGTGDLQALTPILLQTAAYSVLLAGAGLFDLYRKSF
jgi:ABC-type transport system involved in multi-copper enzyme maturation permease subunit